MGLPFVLSIWFSVTVAHCTFFGGLWLLFKQFGLPTEFIEVAVKETVYRVLRESFETDTVADSKGLVEPEINGYSWWYLLCCLLVVLLISICWCVGLCPFSRRQQRQLEDSPRSPQPEIAVIARQQLAEIRLRRHAQ